MTQRAVVAYSHEPDPGCCPVFPSESCPGVTFDPGTVVSLCGGYHQLYEAVHRSLAPRWAARLGLAAEVSEVFSRPVVVVLTHLFFDRLIRLGLLRKRAEGALFVAEAAPLAPPDGLPVLVRLAATSVTANQSVLCALAPLWGFPVKPWPVDDVFARGGGQAARFVNYNYVLRGVADRLRAKARRAAGAARRWWPLRRSGGIPSLSMTYDTSPLEAAGLTGPGGLVPLDLRSLRGGDPPPDASLRKEVFEDSLPGAEARSIFERAGLGEVPPGAAEAFARFLSALTPPNMLEGVPARLGRARDLLARHRSGCVVTAELAHFDSWYAAAAARCLGMEVVGSQHGGGPGNLDHMRSVAELEYPLCDRFITRGWRRFLVPNQRPSLRALPLPNPWLSERAKMWRRRLRWSAARPAGSADLLLMSDKIMAFPRPGMGLDALSSDQLLGQAALLRELVLEASRSGLTVLHKPYNGTTRLLLSRTLEELKALGGARYACDDSTDKGLCPRLVRSCRIVVWDKPSSGFSECVVAGIPTMILWPRFSSVEVPWARGVFRGLEERGVVHRDAKSLCAAYLEYRRSPSAWMADPARRRAIMRFRRRYAWSKEDWPRYWRRALDSFAAAGASLPPGRSS